MASYVVLVGFGFVHRSLECLDCTDTDKYWGFFAMKVEWHQECGRNREQQKIVSLPDKSLLTMASRRYLLSVIKL